MIYEKTLKISKEEAKKYQKLLEQDELDFEKENVEEDSTLKILTTKFENGFCADIKVCTGQHNCYVDPVLFDSKGNEVCVDEPSETILGEYYFKNDEDKYIVNVETES